MGPLGYGLGWRLDTVKGETRIWHSGQCSGYSTLLSLYPDRGEGMAVATNLSGAVDVLQALELAVFHNLNPDWATVTEPARAVEKTSPAPPDALPEGHYRNAGYGDLILSVEGGRLWTRFQNAAPAELRTSPSGKPLLYLSEYRSGFPIDFRVSETTLRIPFEPQVTPIVFHRVDA